MKLSCYYFLLELILAYGLRVSAEEFSEVLSKSGDFYNVFFKSLVDPKNLFYLNSIETTGFGVIVSILGALFKENLVVCIL